MSRPNFLILGQGKSGTSLIWRVLRENPHIAFPEKKELHFFNKGIRRDIAGYDAHFAGLPQDARYIGEVSPAYLHPDAVQLIAEILGRDLKVGFVLRRPVEQAFSRYLQNLCAKPSGYSFERFERFMRARLDKIVDAIALCNDLFGPKNVLPMMYELEVQTAAPTFEAKILSHLGLPLTNYAAPILSGPRVNPGVRPHYIYAGDSAVRVTDATGTYEIPRNTLVFCAQKRNSTVVENPTAQEVGTAMEVQAEWTSEVTADAYEAMQERSIFPAAERMEAELGFDMSHWRNAPKRLEYALAPPPQQFLVR